MLPPPPPALLPPVAGRFLSSLRQTPTHVAACRQCNSTCSLVQLSAMTRLAALHLSNDYRLGQQGEEAFTPLQHVAGSLTSLSLAACGFTRLPVQLSALSHLRELQFGGNHELGGADNGSHWPLQHLTSLTLLDMSRCGLRSIPAQLAELPSLAALELSGNRDLHADSWEMLSELRALTHLGLEWCWLTTPPQQLSALHGLRDLTVSWDWGPMPTSATFRDALCGVLRPLSRLTHLTCLGLGEDLGERLAAAGVHVACVTASPVWMS